MRRFAVAVFTMSAVWMGLSVARWGAAALPRPRPQPRFGLAASARTDAESALEAKDRLLREREDQLQRLLDAQLAAERLRTDSSEPSDSVELTRRELERVNEYRERLRGEWLAAHGAAAPVSESR